MKALRDFERQAIEAMAGDILDSAHLGLLAEIERLDDFEYTGCGYFATIAHPKLPHHTGMLSAPCVIGSLATRDGGTIQAGFLCYLEPGKLILECHTWGEIEIPEEFRDSNVTIRIDR